MADFSLDDYIQTKGKGPSTLRGRIGKKIFSPGRAAVASAQQKGPKWKQGAPVKKPQIIVKGLGNVKSFDARQKLSQKKPTVTDARARLQQKTKFVDARVQITNKKTQQTQQTQVQRSVTNQKGLGTNDMRIKINNSLAKRTDARGMIQARKNANQQQQTKPQQVGQVKVTGLGRPMNKTFAGSKVVSTGPGGGISITTTARPQSQSGMRGRPMAPVGLTKTIQNQNPVPRYQRPQHQPGPQMMRSHPVQYFDQGDMGNMLITTPNTMSQPQMQQQQQQQFHTGGMYSDVGPQMPYMHMQMQEEFYQPQQAVAQPIPTVTGVRKKAKRPMGGPPPLEPATVSMPVAVHHPQPMRTDITVSDTQSPLQGFRVQITNLHPVVSQDDIVELFGSIGAMKKARLVKAGVAEVVFVQRNDAVAAVKKYHMRELDGQPMHVILTSKGPGPKPQIQQQTSQPLRLGKPSSPAVAGMVDSTILHKALFRTQSKEEPMTRPVSFTVKI